MIELTGLAFLLVSGGCIYWYIRRRRAKQKLIASQAKREALVAQIRLLARSGLARQVELSEVIMRTKYLLDHLDHKLGSKHKQIAVIYQMYDALAGFATHAQREALSARVRREQDLQREQIEEFYQEAAFVALRHLLESDFWLD